MVIIGDNIVLCQGDVIITLQSNTEEITLSQEQSDNKYTCQRTSRVNPDTKNRVQRGHCSQLGSEDIIQGHEPLPCVVMETRDQRASLGYSGHLTWRH